MCILGSRITCLHLLILKQAGTDPEAQQQEHPVSLPKAHCPEVACS